MSNLISLEDATNELLHIAQLEHYLQLFFNAYKEGTIKAIPGKEINLKRHNKSLTTPSFTIFADEDFQMWHEKTTETIRNLQPDLNKVATPEIYENVSPEMFLYLAEQSRISAALKLEAVISAAPAKPKSSKKSSSHHKKKPAVEPENLPENGNQQAGNEAEQQLAGAEA